MFYTSIDVEESNDEGTPHAPNPTFFQIGFVHFAMLQRIFGVPTILSQKLWFAFNFGVFVLISRLKT